MMLKHQLFSPIMASVMRKRTETLVITGVAAAQAALVASGLPGYNMQQMNMNTSQVIQHHTHLA